MKSKTIQVSFTFDGYLHDLNKVTPEYVERMITERGLNGGGVLVEVKQ